MRLLAKDRVWGAIIGGAVAFLGLWSYQASAGQLGRASEHLLRFAGLGLLFAAGVLVGMLCTARAGGGEGGGDDGGEQTPDTWTPPPDPIDLELSRIIEEETGRAAPAPSELAPAPTGPEPAPVAHRRR